MGRKTDTVKSKLKAIKTKFDYATCAGSKFETKVKNKLQTCILDEYKKCAKKNNWSKNDLRFNSSVTNNTITVTISAPKPKLEEPNIDALVQSVIDEAKIELKKHAIESGPSISTYNWKEPHTDCSTNADETIVTITITGDEKKLKTSK